MTTLNSEGSRASWCQRPFGFQAQAMSSLVQPSVSSSSSYLMGAVRTSEQEADWELQSLHQVERRDLAFSAA